MTTRRSVRELADDLARWRVDARDRARRVVVERGDLRQVARVDEEHAGARSEHGGDDEQRDDAGAARDADDDGLHAVEATGPSPDDTPKRRCRVSTASTEPVSVEASTGHGRARRSRFVARPASKVAASFAPRAPRWGRPG